MNFRRFAIYYLPPPGPLADFGAAWLGWDIRQGRAIAQPDLGIDLGPATEAAGRYGFHATLKAPFALAADTDLAQLRAAVRDLATALAPVTLDAGLRLVGGADFLALVPCRQPQALTDLAARIVRDLDHFRAPLTPEDRNRRHPARLTPSQLARLDRWGYPWIFDAFRFHMTLTGPVSDPTMVMNLLGTLLPDLDQPHPIARIALVGEAGDGRFHMLEEFDLSITIG